jgi:hypothetical protein
MGWREIIVSLNSLGIGDLDSIRKKLEAVRQEVRAQGQDELAARLDEASSALDRGQLTEYRRLLAQVVSRLGHLRD